MPSNIRVESIARILHRRRRTPDAWQLAIENVRRIRECRIASSAAGWFIDRRAKPVVTVMSGSEVAANISKLNGTATSESEVCRLAAISKTETASHFDCAKRVFGLASMCATEIESVESLATKSALILRVEECSRRKTDKIE